MSLTFDDAALQVCDSLLRDGLAVLAAPPGMGKTTRLPTFLQPHFQSICVVEPRRIAARMAATYVSEQRGQRVGNEVGYQIRFENKTSSRTQLRYLTEGVFLRKMMADPDVSSVDLVILDEFHERSLTIDVLLGLLLNTRKRRKLALLIMSATIDCQGIADALNCQAIVAEGRQHPLSYDYRPRALSTKVADAIHSAARHVLERADDGHILVFLPTMGEIRRAEREVSGLCKAAGLQLHLLHGSLPIETQRQAVKPSNKRKFILSTNVAETSVTIDGVTVVIDSGLANVARSDPWTGLSVLGVERICKASAIQRAGRAGRTRAGHCVRLFSEVDFHRMPTFLEPQILRGELSETLLMLAQHGISGFSELPMLEQPTALAVDAARRLLAELGAFSADGRSTQRGHRMARLPLHPRLSRVLIEAERLGVADEGALAVAILSDGWRAKTAESDASQSDVTAAMRAFMRLPNRLKTTVGKSYTRLRRLVTATDPQSDRLDCIHRALLCGFPDRVTRRERGYKLTIVGRKRAQLDKRSAVTNAPFMLALSADVSKDRRSQLIVRQACAIDSEWLLDYFDGDIDEIVERRFDSEKLRVQKFESICYRDLPIERVEVNPRGDELCAQLLFDRAQKRGLRSLLDFTEFDVFSSRYQLYAQTFPERETLDFGEQTVKAIVLEQCRRIRSFGEFKQLDLFQLIQGRLDYRQLAELQRCCPTHVALTSGRRLSVVYELGRAPRIASRLQDFFGMSDGPRICEGRVPLLLHLLAPNKRPLQITSNLSSFWADQYLEVRKEMRRRYPKHFWPEDAAVAQPPKGGRLR